MIHSTIALALLSQCPYPDPGVPCRPGEAVALLIDDDSGASYVVARVLLVGDDGTHSWRSTYLRFTRDADGPDSPTIPVAEANGRRVRACLAHDNGAVVVLGGMPRADFAMASAVEAFAGEVAPRPTDDLLRRLGSGVWREREAASAELEGRGAGAIGPCLAGLRSGDAEVRGRCAAVLDELRFGRVGR